MSCTHTTTKEDIELTMKVEQSWKVELNKMRYTVYFLSKPPVEIKFNLTQEEKNKIKDLYYSFKLNKLSDNQKINDLCSVMPKIYTYITIKSKGNTKEIKIYDHCDRFSILQKSKALRIKKFIQYIYAILESKPEVKNAPKSDIIYL